MSVNNISVKPINDLSSTPSLQDTDNLLAQTSNGFKKVPISQLKEEVSVDTSTFAPTTILKDTVGWTGMNLLPYPYQRVTSSNGVTWTDNGDGTITADGTATANSWVTLAGTISNPAEIPNSIKKIIGQEVILSSGEETNGVGIRIDFFDSNKERLIDKNTDTPKYAKFVIPSNSEYIALQCFVYSGRTVNNLTFYPMLRRADIADDTWEPYHESVEEVVESKLNDDYANLYGAKNLIPYPYYRESGYTSRGMTGTYDSDGVITITKTEGTDTANFTLYRGDNNLEPNTEYVLSVELLNAINTSIYLSYNDVDVAAIRNKSTGKHEVNFTTPDTTTANVAIGLYWGKSVVETNAIIKPMLRRASIKDDTWVPYAKTNKQLTEETAEIKDKITTVKATYDEDTALYAHAVGDIVYVNEHFYKVTAAIAVGDTIATGTNVTADTGLAVDTPIYVSNLPNS